MRLQKINVELLIYLSFKIALNTLYRSNHDRQFCEQRKLLHTVGQGSVL